MLIHMPATLDTRKPVVKLTASDLRAFPIWEYAIDEEGVGEQDETWVRPVNGTAIRKDTYSQLVATDFTTPSGKKFQGFMIVTTAQKPVRIDPGAVVGKVGYRVLPHMSREQAVQRHADSVLEDRDRLLSALGQPEADVFPLRYELRVLVRGEKEVRVGRIPSLTPPRVSSSPARIERLIAGDGGRLRAVRLRALSDAPDAFGTTLEEALAAPPESWERQLEELATFVATADNGDIGLARGARHDRLSDVGYILSMWVAPDARRLGIATDLIDAVADWARTEGLNCLLLDAVESNAPAMALYVRKGFAPNGACGTLPPPREHVREIQLEVKL